MIEIKSLYKHYGKLVAVKNLTLTVPKGEIFGFIGPNGAGKSTTIKILSTLLTPTAGICKINGIDVVKYPYEVRKILGYMPDLFGLYEELKVWEYLDFFAACHKIAYKNRKGIINDILELTDLTVKRDAAVGSLSRGMKQRLCLAKTLIHDPLVLVLDEPASGLDPRGRIEMRALLNELRKMGKTIFVSSHILTELADFCTSVGIIEAGKLAVSGLIPEVVKKEGVGRHIRVKILDRVEECQNILSEYETISNLSGAVVEKVFTFDMQADDEALCELLRRLITAGIPVISFYDKGGNLEDIFMKVTKGQVS
ncbi:MAG TPA: ABC transporter ATP-binding protein [Candidatus Wallbacteria bacterium]|nr:ABC transporter ATP-binding protein [Candidatus Wallbacteria bacterium]